jgi:DNA helicase-2/ATP-dependent DNA helicase PcrA
MAVPDDLDPAQRAAVESEAAPLCIVAAAGSGKTRVLTRRIAHRVQAGTADPAHVLALTFTRKAAAELRTRLRGLGVEGVTAGTFHAVAWAQLRRRCADRGERAPVLLQHAARLVARVVEDPASVAAVAAEITWAKARLVVPAGYVAAAAAAGRPTPVAAAEVAAAYARYEDEKRRRGVVDFDDLLSRCADAMEADPAFAEAQRWRFRHLFVDEFQDVNPAQFRLLRSWLGDRNDLTVVGDPNQAVYGWNGSDPDLLVRFPHHFPAAEVLRLDTNYRSTPEILAVAATVLDDATPGPVGGAGPSRPPRHPARPAGAVPTVAAFHTGEDEARAIARSVRLARAPGAPWSDIAVLTRTNAQLVAVAEALTAAGIPHRSRGAAFLGRPEVRAALDMLRQGATGVPVTSRLSDLAEAAADEADEARRANIDTLARLASDYAAVDRSGGVDAFLAWLGTAVRGEEPEAMGDAVELATFHRAKGLEWPVVFVAGLEDGLVPIGHAATTAAVAEERRLLYVALTRATRELHCSWAEERTVGSRRSRRTPSPWLPAIETACRTLAAGPARSTDWRRHLADSRARLAACERDVVGARS